MTKKIGLYFHVPFCAVKCDYCNFYSVKYSRATEESYVSALLEHIKRYDGCEYVADTLYFGGGTPSLMQSNNISKIIDECSRVFSLSLSNNAELTLEANPNTVSLTKLSELSKAGINRISFGMQSSSSTELAALGRHHTAQHVIEAVNSSIRCGINNISLDLMLGTPYQTINSLEQSLLFVSELPINHLSAYMLKVEENTPLFSADNMLSHCANEDELSDMYLHTVDFLSKHGLSQYEISNFAVSGYESRHNLKYWHGNDYIGFGASAHSHLNKKRFCHPNDIADYINTTGCNIMYTDENADDLEEYVMLQLRLSEGLDLKQLSSRCNVDVINLKMIAQAYISHKLASLRNDVLSLTPEGFLVSNLIIFDLISEIHNAL